MNNSQPKFIWNTLKITEEEFSKLILSTKMLLSNVLGHVAEHHFEKYLTRNNISYKKAPTDVFYDYLVTKKRVQVKRWESISTNSDQLGVNLTKTHGDRSGEHAFYSFSDFDELVICDVGFETFCSIDIKDITKNQRYKNRLKGSFNITRELDTSVSEIDKEFVKVMKVKNREFPLAINQLTKEKSLTYKVLLEEICHLDLNEINNVFTVENFRLITGLKGFVAELYFNKFLDKYGITYVQDTDMYSKVDHWINSTIRVQVKIPNERANNELFWGVKTHKSHGSGVLELYEERSFDILALFIGFKMDYSISKYLPIDVTPEFLFIPEIELKRHPKHPKHLCRISKIEKNKYSINNYQIFKTA
jgi:hypothetical protein